MRALHIIAGLSGIASGAVALYALKGSTLHRKSGMVFVYTMLFMSASGAVMAALKPQRISVVAGVLTFYLVLTALLTVRPRAEGSRWLDAGAMLVGLAAGIAGFTFALRASSSAAGTLEGLPAAPGFMFGTVALLATLGDIRILARGIAGARRIARHLWRMCFAMFIATASFFLGQPQVFPRGLRRSGVLAIPVLLVVSVMIYWMVRVRSASFKPKLVRGSA